MIIPVFMFVPVETPSITNQREHWRKRQQRALNHRAQVRTRWLLLGRPKIPLPAEVHLVRVAPRSLDDDNLRGALKHIRDGVAAELGVDDRDPRVQWSYAQEKRPTGSSTGVRVTIGEVPMVCPTCGRKRDAA